ncbi:MAG: SGNH/GDSL hydrolase family protein [Armatimonadota bacterium]
MRRPALATALIVCATAICAAQPYLLEDFNSPEALEGREAVAATRTPAQFSLVPDGVTGGAISVRLPGMVRLDLDPALLEGNAEWDACNGVSLMVRGDGSESWGCIQFAGGGSNGGFSYSLYVSLRDRSWHEVRAHFSELVTADAALHGIGEPGMLPPSGIARITLGDRWTIHWNNQPMPEHSFSIDDVRLIADAPEPPPAPLARPLEEVLRMMRDRQPMTIQCMGDSITAGTGLPDRDTQRYAVLLQQRLRERLGYDGIVCYSRAVGGAKFNHGRAWYRRDFAGVQPDIVTIAYGYNDKSAGFPADYIRYCLEDYCLRIARVTDGAAAICPITTLPGGGPRFVMMDDYARQIRDFCAGREGIHCIDLAAQIKPMGREAWGALLGDMAHPNQQGHEWLADAIADWLIERMERL